MNVPWKQLSSALLTSEKLQELLEISALKDRPSKTVILIIISRCPSCQLEDIMRDPNEIELDSSSRQLFFLF